MSLDDVLRLIISNLEKLGIPYMVAGSLASSAYGLPRSTLDADIVVDLRREHVQSFMDTFTQGFYVDRGQIDQAMSTGQSCNIIHLESFLKADLFVLARTPFAQEQFARRLQRPFEGTQIFLATAEDTVLSKLLRYRQGGEASGMQWRDVNGILKAQSRKLDLGYLRKWAGTLGVSDLLERAFSEAGIRSA